jgi:nanoRNase/pAp phosphatase (c-di-AMP/oligoRNAs hydrolase)
MAPLTLDARKAVLTAIHAKERFLLVTHERPDGDALGSLVGMQALLRGLDKDSVMLIAPEDFPLPAEYRFFSLDGLVTAPPEDLAQRAVVYLDCGNLDRNAVVVPDGGEALINIDHHHDNTRFGTINYVVEDASCTAEIVWDLMHVAGVDLTTEVAEALYVGLVTDTGRFSYENTTIRAPASTSPRCTGASTKGSRWPSSSCWGAPSRPSRSTPTVGSPSPSCKPPTSKRRAPRTATVRGSSITCARSKASRSRC